MSLIRTFADLARLFKISETAPINGQALVWNEGTGKWEPGAGTTTGAAFDVGPHRYWALLPIFGVTGNVQFQAIGFYAGATRVYPTSFAASSFFGTGYEPANLLDDTGSYWAASGLSAWLTADFTTPVSISSIEILPVSAALSQAPFQFSVAFSDDGQTWYTLSSYGADMATWASGVWNTFPIPMTMLGVVGGTGNNIVTDATTARTASLTDGEKYIQFTSSSATTFTIPPNTDVAFPVGTVIEFEQSGTGSLTIAAGSGVTINSRGTDYTLAGQFSTAFVKKVGTNEWTLGGDL